MLINKRPRILFITYVVPWRPRYGGSHRCFGVIKGLAEHSDLHVAYACSDPGGIEAFQKRPTLDNVTLHVLSPDPSFGSMDDWHASRTVQAVMGRGKYRAALQQVSQTIDPNLVWYFDAESVRRTTLLHRTYAVLDHDNVRWKRQVRQAQLETGVLRGRALFKAAALRFDDVQLALRFSHSYVASPDGRTLLWPARTVSVLPNGFDFATKMYPVSLDSRRLIFFGSLFYQPNIDGVRWMCQEIWPIVRARIPDAQLDIVGLGGEELTDLAKIPGVKIHGFVTDLDKMIQESAALVVPLRVGEGTRIKIIEAWAKGLPVISTTVGAEGLGSRHGETLLIGDTAEAFASCCTTILADPTLRQKLAKEGYRHGKSKFDWPVVHRKMQDDLDNLLMTRKGA